MHLYITLKDNRSGQPDTVGHNETSASFGRKFGHGNGESAGIIRHAV